MAALLGARVGRSLRAPVAFIGAKLEDPKAVFVETLRPVPHESADGSAPTLRAGCRDVFWDELLHRAEALRWLVALHRSQYAILSAPSLPQNLARSRTHFSRRLRWRSAFHACRGVSARMKPALRP